MNRTALRRRLETPLALVGALALIGVCLILPGEVQARTPAAIVFAGAIDGLATALIAAAIVLVYRTSRIINFLAIGLGVGGGYLALLLIQLTRVPFPIAILVGMAMGALVGLLFDLVFGLRFRNAPRLVVTVATLFAAEPGGIVSFFYSKLDGIPGIPAPNERPASVGTDAIRDSLPFSGFHFQVGDFPEQFGFAEILCVVLAVLALGSLIVFLRRSRTGTAIRAVAENVERAGTLGISATRLSFIVWSIAGALSSCALTMVGLLGTQASFGEYFRAPDVILPALAAAVIARMESFAVAALVAVGLTALQVSLRFQVSNADAVVDGALFVALFGGLLFRGRGIARSERATGSWEGTREVRPIPAELRSIPLIRWGRPVAALALLGLVVLLPFVVAPGEVFTLSTQFVAGIVAVSLVVMTGWAGQASAGQYALVAVGSLTTGALASRAGMPFIVAVVGGTVVTAVLSLLLAFPALRIRGIFLIAVTLAFAVMAHSLLFDVRYFGWLQPRAIVRPTFLIFNFDDERTMYFLCLSCLVITVMVIRNLRRSRFGRLLVAVRDNEADATTSGVNVLRLKLEAFALTGVVAGFAGALLAYQQRGADATTFDAHASLLIFEMIIIGGAASVSGALTGVTFFYLIGVLGSLFGPAVSSNVAYIPLVALAIAPGGIFSELTRVRDAMLRLIAERRQMIVPSLLADQDAAVVENRLIPLGGPGSRPALDSLRTRYAQRSPKLGHIGGLRVLVETGASDVARRREASVIQAAAGRAADDISLTPQEVGS